MVSVVSICNRALQKLGAARITSIDQNSVNARACNACYEQARDYLLRVYVWNFSITRTNVASTTSPTDRYPYAYQIPSDCVRVLPADQNEGIYMTDWKLEGQLILTTESAPLYLKYAARIEDPTKFDPIFAELLSTKMAMEMCEELTQSNSKLVALKDQYKDALNDAKRTNALEQLPINQGDDTFITVRY